MLIEFKNKIYEGSAGRKSLFDCVIPNQPKGLIIFCHGYKGFKDWGAWNLFETFFTNQHYGFLKFNFSHNGGTVDNPIDFSDVEAFGQNRYSYELNDLRVIIDEANRMLVDELELSIPLHVIGHSRGGGMAILAGAAHPKVKSIVSIAGISDIKMRFPKGEQLRDWEQNGVLTVENSRTKQTLPHYFTFYTDFIEHEDQLTIDAKLAELDKPFVQIHGDMDTSVSISEGLANASNSNTELKIVKGADHTFGTKQPWDEKLLPPDLLEVGNNCLKFFENQD